MSQHSSPLKVEGVCRRKEIGNDNQENYLAENALFRLLRLFHQFEFVQIRASS